MTAASYNPRYFPVVAPPGWKAVLRSIRSDGSSCSNDSGGTYRQRGNIYPPERPIFADTYLALRHGEEHRAMDIMAAMGQPIIADSDGEVIRSWRYEGETRPGVGHSEKGGNYAWIKGDDGVERYYAHMIYPASVRIGERIKAGQIIGFVGDTGNARGGCPHLHYATSINGQKFNPYSQLRVLYDQEAWKKTPLNWYRWLWVIPLSVIFSTALGAGIYYGVKKINI